MFGIFALRNNSNHESIKLLLISAALLWCSKGTVKSWNDTREGSQSP